MDFEEAKAVTDTAVGVLDTLYRVAELVESVKQYRTQKTHTRLIEFETEILQEKIRQEQIKFLAERKKVAPEFERIQKQLNKELDTEMIKPANEYQVTYRIFGRRKPMIKTL